MRKVHMRNNYSKEKTIVCKGEYLNEEGRTIIKDDKEVISVPFLLPLEEAEITYSKVGKHYHTRINKLIKTSNDRVKARCPHYTVCGGCQMMHMSYDAQLKHKTKIVKRLMKSIPVDPVIGMDEPWFYRNKVISSFAHQKKVTSGFYKMYSHDVVTIQKCYVQDQLADPIIKTINSLANKYKLRVYNEDTKNGFLRHVLIRTGHVTGEVLIVLVVSNKVFPGKSGFVKDLIKSHPEIKTIVQNVNSRKTSVVLGDQEIVLYGNGQIKDKLCGLTFSISSKSFYQINPVQTEKLYNLANEMANINKNDIVVDTYSGIGTISLIAAKKAKQVFGVEINKDAVKNAIKNAKVNQIKNVRFITGDAGHTMVQMAKEKMPITTVIMDPPRSGSDEKFLSSVVKLKPQKIVYISCNPVTQKRDMDFLIKRGYKVKKVVPVDMFPMTHHVETCALLTK